MLAPEAGLRAEQLELGAVCRSAGPALRELMQQRVRSGFPLGPAFPFQA